MGVLSSPLSRLIALLAVTAAISAMLGFVPRQKNWLSVASFVQLLSTSVVVGTGNWVTFVAGLVMFKALPRHQFGQLQSKLFPAYFLFTLVAQAIALVSNVMLTGRTAGRETYVQVAGLACTLLNLLAIEPATTKTMFDRHRVEKDQDPAASGKTPELRRLSKKFGMLHGLSSLANLGTLAAAHVHLWSISQHINY